MELIKKLYFKYRDIILYGFVGGLTTVVNIAVFWICYNPLNLSTAVSTAIAWLVAVIFAFITNKLYVFSSKSMEMSVLLREFISFMAFRILSGALDMAIMVAFVDHFHFNEMLIKIISNIIVVIINYVASKLIIFKHKAAPDKNVTDNEQNKDWQKVIISTTYDGIEAVTGRLYQAGLGGAEIEDEREFNEFLENNRQSWDYVDEALRDKMKQDTKVIVYITNDAPGAELLTAIKATLGELKDYDTEGRYGALDVSLEDISEEDWANSWKQYFKPIPVGKRVLIKPLWEDMPENSDGRIVFNIDPGMVFGTGTHETTRLCIEAAEEHVKLGDTVLDLGCGSGILSVISLMLGADRALAVDIDPKAYDIAYANAERNNIDKSRYNVLVGNVITDNKLQDEIGYNKYDVIFANIVADVIIALSPLMAKQIKKDGVLITSGIIEERSGEVASALKNCGFELIKQNTENSWVSIVCRLS